MSAFFFDRSNMFVHPLLLKLQTKNANRLEYAFPEYVKNVLLTECAVTLFYTKTWIIKFKWNILSILPTKLPTQTWIFWNIEKCSCFCERYQRLVNERITGERRGKETWRAQGEGNNCNERKEFLVSFICENLNFLDFFK